VTLADIDVDLEELEEEIEADDEPIVPVTDQQIDDAFQNISFRVIYQTNSFLLPQLRDLIEEGEVINVRPEYQRRSRWTNKKKSQLIESLLLNVPIPSLFFYESDLARYEVMDGQQRMNAIADFLAGTYALTGMEKLPFLNRKKYNDLTPRVKRSLDRASLSAVVLLQESKADEDDPFVIRRYVFEKLNTGGEKLNAQELRNSLYRSDFNKLIVKMAKQSEFCKIFGIPEYTELDEDPNYVNSKREKNQMYKTMADCQAILRVFALKDDANISGSMKVILDRCMKNNLARTPEEVEAMNAQFKEVLKASTSFFTGQAFLLPPNEKGKQRVSLAFFDAVMVAVWRRFERLDQMKAASTQIQQNIAKALVENLEALTGKANTAASIRDRIKVVGAAIDDAI
jgi:hypothetical protein